MGYETPDERRDFTGWSVERFGDQCFVNFSSAAPAGIGRTGISRRDFDAAISGDRNLSDLVPRSARNDPIIEKTPKWAKILVFIAALVLVGTGIAVMLLPSQG